MQRRQNESALCRYGGYRSTAVQHSSTAGGRQVQHASRYHSSSAIEVRLVHMRSPGGCALADWDDAGSCAAVFTGVREYGSNGGVLCRRAVWCKVLPGVSVCTMRTNPRYAMHGLDGALQRRCSNHDNSIIYCSCKPEVVYSSYIAHLLQSRQTLRRRLQLLPCCCYCRCRRRPHRRGAW